MASPQETASRRIAGPNAARRAAAALTPISSGAPSSRRAPRARQSSQGEGRSPGRRRGVQIGSRDRTRPGGRQPRSRRSRLVHRVPEGLRELVNLLRGKEEAPVVGEVFRSDRGTERGPEGGSRAHADLVWCTEFPKGSESSSIFSGGRKKPRSSARC